MYSEEKTVTIVIKTENEKLILKILNSGKTLNTNEQNNLFQPFMRGENAKNTTGLGLGLRIVNRILNAYGYTIHYTLTDNLNTFQITF